MCQVLNKAMLDKIDSDLIIIIAKDGCNLKRKSEGFKKGSHEKYTQGLEQNASHFLNDFCLKIKYLDN